MLTLELPEHKPEDDQYLIVLDTKAGNGGYNVVLDTREQTQLFETETVLAYGNLEEVIGYVMSNDVKVNIWAIPIYANGLLRRLHNDVLNAAAAW